LSLEIVGCRSVERGSTTVLTHDDVATASIEEKKIQIA